MTQLAPAFCNEHKVIVTAETETEIVIGYSTESLEAINRIKRSMQNVQNPKTIVTEKISESDLLSRLSVLKPNEQKESQIFTPENYSPAMCDITQYEESAPTVTLLHSIILAAHELHASDIHIENFLEATTIRFRIDGVLRTSQTLTTRTGKLLSSRIKVLSNLNILESRRPQEGRFSFSVRGLQKEMRISIIPSLGTESIVLRFLGFADNPPEIKTLGFSNEYVSLFKEISNLPSGLVLITGPTGSGKTTTLCALLNACNPREKKIISIEDPVEYRVNSVMHIQVNEQIDLGYSQLLKMVVRQDPDILMIGEIRDKETAELAVRASLTGHLVLSTLHTNSTHSVPKRLHDLGVPYYLIDEVLLCVLTQHLVRKLCPSCQKSYQKNCPKCMGTAYSGRIPIVESWLKNRTYSFPGLIQYGADLVKKGKTDMREITRVLGETL